MIYKAWCFSQKKKKKESDIDTLLLTKLETLFWIYQFFHNGLFLFEDPIQGVSCSCNWFSVVISPQSLVSICLCFHDLDRGTILCNVLPSGLSDIFSMIKPGRWIFGRSSVEVNCPLFTLLWGHMKHVTVSLAASSLVRVVFHRFYTTQLLFAFPTLFFGSEESRNLVHPQVWWQWPGVQSFIPAGN